MDSNDHRRPSVWDGADADVLGREVLIVGNGVGGYCIAVALEEAGLRTALVDAGTATGRGATVSNEGWLHAGTYHSVSQASEETAATGFEAWRKLRAGDESLASSELASAVTDETRRERVALVLSGRCSCSEDPLRPALARVELPRQAQSLVTLAAEVSPLAGLPLRVVMRAVNDVSGRSLLRLVGELRAGGWTRAEAASLLVRTEVPERDRERILALT